MKIAFLFKIFLSNVVTLLVVQNYRSCIREHYIIDWTKYQWITIPEKFYYFLGSKFNAMKTSLKWNFIEVCKIKQKKKFIKNLRGRPTVPIRAGFKGGGHGPGPHISLPPTKSHFMNKNVKQK